MKKFLVLILSVIAAFAAAISLTACEAKVDKDGNVTITDGDKSNDNNNGSSGSGSGNGSGSGTGGEQGNETPEHSHTYDKQVATETYLKSVASCTRKAVYYYSCKCGEKGEQTFEYGALSTIHPFSSKWMNDQTYHYHKSTCIHQVEKDKEKHIFNSNDVCSVCGVEKQVEIQLYIDGGYSESIYTDKTKGYKISEPEKPEDISTNPNSEKYFYGWFTDYNYQTPFTDNTTFKTNSKLYAKWITVYSTDYRYSVSYGKATITGYNWGQLPTVLVIPAYINSFPVKNIAIDAFKGRTEIRTEYINEYIKNNRVSPTINEIAQNAGCAVSTAYKFLERLKDEA